jgi:HK97 gp10 family phage protein
MGLSVTDHTGEFERELRRQIRLGLMECGAHGEGIAAGLCPVDTGRLRASITSGMVDDSTVAVGTDVEYASHVENGTSRQKAQPYLRPAIENHKGDYKAILESRLNGG